MSKCPAGNCVDKRREETATFILSLQLKLLQKALAHWPRRTTRLLEINCGDGAYLPFLWQTGFDLTATEPNPELRRQAQARQNLDIRAVSDDNLPFDDDFFDWAILHVIPGPDWKLAASVNESLRVARKGLLFTFWNSASLPCLCWRASHIQPWPANALPMGKMWRLIRSLNTGELRLMTTLAGPFWSWRNRRFFEVLNTFISSWPLGAWGLARLDLDTAKLGTPLRLRLENIMPQTLPAMEYAERKFFKKSDK